MTARPSQRIADFVAALPLRPGMRVLEIGCGAAIAARLVAGQVGAGRVLATDRSPAAILLAAAGCSRARDAGLLELRRVAAADLRLIGGEAPYDLAFAMKVGTLDGRLPAELDAALAGIAGMLTPEARLYIDGGDPLREVALPPRRRGGAAG